MRVPVEAKTAFVNAGATSGIASVYAAYGDGTPVAIPHRILGRDARTVGHMGPPLVSRFDCNPGTQLNRYARAGALKAVYARSASRKAVTRTWRIEELSGSLQERAHSKSTEEVEDIEPRRGSDGDARRGAIGIDSVGRVGPVALCVEYSSPSL